MARRGEVSGHVSRLRSSHALALRQGLTVRSLRNGDTETVSALFARLGERSRERRFCGAKPRLSELELANLARVDRDHHVLVGYVDGDPEPAGIARLVRDGSSAEIAFAVADEYQSRATARSSRASSPPTRARRASPELMATVCGDNPRIVALLQRLGSIDVTLARRRARVRRRAERSPTRTIAQRVHGPRRDRAGRAPRTHRARRFRPRRRAGADLVRRSSSPGCDQHHARARRRAGGAANPGSRHSRRRVLRRRGVRELGRRRAAAARARLPQRHPLRAAASATGRMPAFRSSGRNP